MAKKNQKAPESIIELCDSVYEEHGNTHASVELVYQSLRANEEFRDRALRLAAHEGLLDAQRRKRHVAVQEGVRNSQTFYSSEQQRRTVEKVRGLLAWPLTTGKILRDATKEEILIDSSKFLKMGKANVRNAWFLRKVAESLEDGETGAKLEEKTLQDLYLKAEEEVEEEVK